MVVPEFLIKNPCLQNVRNIRLNSKYSITGVGSETGFDDGDFSYLSIDYNIYYSKTVS